MNCVILSIFHSGKGMATGQNQLVLLVRVKGMEEKVGITKHQKEILGKLELYYSLILELHNYIFLLTHRTLQKI
jgi:hypothetical protein